MRHLLINAGRPDRCPLTEMRVGPLLYGLALIFSIGECSGEGTKEVKFIRRGPDGIGSRQRVQKETKYRSQVQNFSPPSKARTRGEKSKAMSLMKFSRLTGPKKDLSEEEAYSRSDSASDSASDSDSASETGSDSASVSESESESNSEIESELEFRPESRPQTRLRSLSTSPSESASEPDLGSESDATSESESDSEADSGSNLEAKPELKTHGSNKGGVLNISPRSGKRREELWEESIGDLEESSNSSSGSQEEEGTDE